tara:strand:- start:638 stop:1252 length:615 start_codon:yes stop_codon:yes gene_type:complete
MSKNILYYSTYCKNCDKLLNILNKSNLQSTLNFINIDKRVIRNNSIYIILNDEKELLLPVTITKVPALLLIDNGHQVLFGNQIYQHLQPKEKQYKQDITNNDEPSSFSLDNNICSIYGVVSDNFSFLDQSSDSLNAKGNGGLRQLYTYSTINDNYSNSIETPKEDYTPDKIGNVSMDKLQIQRETDIKLIKPKANIEQYFKKKG